MTLLKQFAIELIRLTIKDLKGKETKDNFSLTKDHLVHYLYLQEEKMRK